jgi:hypothetical protein
VPPLTGVAVKVTDVPAQTGFADGVIDTLAGRLEFTVIVMIFDASGLPVVQVRLEVITT